MNRVADIAAKTLYAHGVRHAFGMPGGEVVTFIDALQAAGVSFVLARHETAAAFMAASEGVNRDAPGLLVTTVGPGLANAINGIADASQEHAPLIVVSGVVDHDIRHRYTHQVFDQAALLRPLVKGTIEIEPEGVGATMARAIRLAMTHPRGPVHVDLAPGTAAKAAQPSDRCVDPPRSIKTSATSVPDAFTTIVTALQDAKRPLIVAGLGAVDAEAGPQLTALAECIGAPVVTTYKAKGILPEDHTLSLGGAGLSPKADAVLLPLLKLADVVILAGYDPIEMRPGWFDPFGEAATIVDLTAHPADHGMHRVTHQYVGQVDAALATLIGGLSKAPCDVPRWPSGAIENARTALNRSFECDAAWGPHAIIAGLQATLDDRTLVTVDSGAHRILLSQMLRVGHPRQIQQSAGFCTMGTALPSAIGVKHAKPDHHVIAVLGDGGLEMGLGELATLRDTQTAITVLVFQDESLALIEMKQATAGLAEAGVRLGLTPFEDIASAYGGVGTRVSTRQDLETALAAARSAPVFSLIVCAFDSKAYVDAI